MEADINIINRALIKLGEPPLSSTNQQPAGPKLEIIYNDCVESLISLYPWSFATRREYLAEVPVEIPGSRFNHAYRLPSDLLVLLQVYEHFKAPNFSDCIMLSDKRYDVEGEFLVCDTDGPLFIRYVRRTEKASLFPKTFREALICMIAAEYAPTLHKKQADLERIDRMFLRWIEKARENEEISEDAETIPDASWVAVRELW